MWHDSCGMSHDSDRGCMLHVCVCVCACGGSGSRGIIEEHSASHPSAHMSHDSNIHIISLHPMPWALAPAPPPPLHLSPSPPVPQATGHLWQGQPGPDVPEL